jgi:RNA polymerase sigma-70 factor (ECF subfamily)
LGVIKQVVSETEEAEDVLQKTFVRIWTSFDSYDPAKGRLYTWMLRIARNLAIDSVRSKHEKMKSQTRHIGAQEQLIDRHYVAQEKYHDGIGLTTLLQKLGAEHRHIIDLAYYEGYTQEEIAQQLNIPLGTIKTRIRQALQQLRVLTTKDMQRE